MPPSHLKFIPALLGLFAAIACAQQDPKGDIFAGFSYANTDFGAASRASTYGYELTSQIKVRRWLGIVFAGHGHFGNAIVPVCLGTSANSCVTPTSRSFAHLYIESGGVQASKQVGRLTPFARALFGVGILDACPVFTCESKGSFVQAYGGGVDYRISERRFGWRVQAEFVQTRFFSSTQNDGRLATGLMINFYGHH
jgi:hypothetical protein